MTRREVCSRRSAQQTRESSRDRGRRRRCCRGHRVAGSTEATTPRARHLGFWSASGSRSSRERTSPGDSGALSGPPMRSRGIALSIAGATLQRGVRARRESAAAPAAVGRAGSERFARDPNPRTEGELDNARYSRPQSIPPLTERSSSSTPRAPDVLASRRVERALRCPILRGFATRRQGAEIQSRCSRNDATGLDQADLRTIPTAHQSDDSKARNRIQITRTAHVRHDGFALELWTD